MEIKNENELHEKFKLYGANAKEWMKKCILLLPEIHKRKIWAKKKYGSIYEYAAMLAGMSRAKVDEALWIFNKIEDKPELKKIIAEKGLYAVKPIANIVTKETQNFWGEKARIMSRHTLETYVREFKKNTDNSWTGPRIENKHSQITPKVIISMDLDQEISEKLLKLKGKGAWNELMKQFLELREQQIKQKKEKVEKDTEKKADLYKAASRHIPEKIKRLVLYKSNNQCAFPECKNPYEILHHTDRFALSKFHNPDKIVPLCKCHEQLAHLGLIENEELQPEYWRVRQKPEINDLKYMIDKRVLEHRLKALK
jgi:hypothetical protein